MRTSLPATLRMIRGDGRALPAWSVALQQKRLADGLTQIEAAMEYGVHERTYRGWESGEGDGRMLAGFLGLEKARAA